MISTKGDLSVLSVVCPVHVIYMRIKFGLENFYYIKGRATEKKGGLTNFLRYYVVFLKLIHYC